MLDKDLINEINNRADIVTVVGNYLRLQKKGRIYVALCPFHNDTNPSLQVDPNRNTFCCWVDKTYGNSFTFVMQYEKINFVEAVKKVANIINFDDERLHDKKKTNFENKKLFDCINDLNSYYEYFLQSSEGEEALNYLNNNRNLSNEIIKKFHIGFSSKDGAKTIFFLRNKGYSIKTIEDIGIVNTYETKIYDRNQGRITFPIFDQNNHIVGFSSRTLSSNRNDLKYVNSPGTKIFFKSNILYNFNNAKTEAKRLGYIFLLEGFMDVIALEKIGFNNAVALMGTSITKQHILLLKNLNVEVRIFLDGDSAGNEASLKIILSLFKSNIDVRIVNNNTEFDPDELINKNGLDYVKKMLLDLLTPFDFAIKYYKNKLTDKFSNNKREKIIDFFIPFIKSVKFTGSVNLEDCIMKLQDITNFNHLAIKKKIEDATKNNYNVKNYFKGYGYKIKKTKLDFLKKIEQEMLFYMFLKKEAADFYKKNMGYFNTDIYRKLANFVLDQYINNDKININLLITDIEISSENDKNDLKKEIFFFDIWKKKHLKYLNFDNLELLLKDYKNKIDNLKKEIDYEKGIDDIFSKKFSEETISKYKDLQKKYKNGD